MGREPLSLNRTRVFQVNVGEESTGRDGCLAAVLLHVDSSLMAAVCGLHHAVLRRLQVNTHR